MTLGNAGRAGAVGGYFQGIARPDSRTGFWPTGLFVRNLWGDLAS